MSELNSNIMVSICCITYNHEAYIRECLDGFLQQKCNFLFEILIHDDASTDKTAKIIRDYATKYPDIIKPILQVENQYSKGVGFGYISNLNFSRAQGKYIAICEGDDYWVDPQKLQTQIEFMEANPKYGMSFGEIFVYSQREDKKYYRVSRYWDEENGFANLLATNPIPTCTVVVNKEILLDSMCLPVKEQNWKMGDYPRWLYISNITKIKHFDNIFCCYRELPNSASHGDMSHSFEFNKSVYEIKLWFINKYKTTITEELLSYQQCILSLKLLLEHKKRYNIGIEYIKSIYTRYCEQFSFKQKIKYHTYLNAYRYFHIMYYILFISVEKAYRLKVSLLYKNR